MITYLRSVLAGFISTEVKASQRRYNNKLAECRDLTTRALKSDREADQSKDMVDSLKRQIEVLEKAVEQHEMTIEARDNKIMLTEQIVTQQQSMIHRDIALRKLEHITASAQVGMARTHTGIKEDSNAANESDVNYRPGR